LANVCLWIIRHIADVRLLCCLAFHHTRNACLFILHRWSPCCYRRLLPDTTTTLHTPVLLQVHALHSSAHCWVSALFTPLVCCLQTSRALHGPEYSKLKPPLSLKGNKIGPIFVCFVS
jgi:hypothetical protein